MEILDTKDLEDTKVDDRGYRRGYRHGYHQALRDIRGGHKLSQLYAWTKQLRKWNLFHNPFTMAIPPAYPEKFKGDKE
jgi:hypothetical protein